MIEVNNLSKDFKVYRKIPGFLGSLQSVFKRDWIEKKALKNISFKVNEGEIVGLIGSNGAGKTTLAKILSGIVHPTSGEVSVMGHTPWLRNNNFRKQMSLIMGQKASLWWDLPAMDCYLLLKEIYQISNKDFKNRLEELSESLKVGQELNIQIRRLSLGERMKMELIAALLHNPKVVYLDEPTIGLDLSAQKAIRNFLLEYKKKYNPIMLLTSHYMEDIEKLCERIIILKNGEMLYDGKLSEIKSNFNEFKIIKAHFDIATDQFSWPSHLGEVVEINENTLKVKTIKNNLSSAIEFLVSNFNIQDIGIEEVEVSEIIEQTMSKGI